MCSPCPLGGWFWLIPVGLVVVFLVLGFFARRRPGSMPFSCFPPRVDSQSQEKPLDILKHRYARGELTKEQYEQMKRDIES